MRLPASYIGSHSIVKVGTKSVWGRCMIRLTEALIQVLHITNRHFIWKQARKLVIKHRHFSLWKGFGTYFPLQFPRNSRTTPRLCNLFDVLQIHDPYLYKVLLSFEPHAKSVGRCIQAADLIMLAHDWLKGSLRINPVTDFWYGLALAAHHSLLSPSYHIRAKADGYSVR